MGLLGSLKRAEEQGREAARHGVHRAGEVWEDAQRRLRRKMRIHPRRNSAAADDATSSTSASGRADIHKPAA